MTVAFIRNSPTNLPKYSVKLQIMLQQSVKFECIISKEKRGTCTLPVQRRRRTEKDPMEIDWFSDGAMDEYVVAAGVGEQAER